MTTRRRRRRHASCTSRRASRRRPRCGSASAWAENTRLRVVGTRVLVDAALATGVTRVIAESITFIYCDGGSEWLDERSPVDARRSGCEPVVTLEHEVAALHRRRRARRDRVAIRVVLRARCPQHRRVPHARARRRSRPVLGPRRRLRVVDPHRRRRERGRRRRSRAPPGVYNVVDDVPLTRREYADAFAARVRAPAAADHSARRSCASSVARPRRCWCGRSGSSNAALKAATGWAPATPSAVDGWAAIAADRKESVACLTPDRRPGHQRAARAARRAHRLGDDRRRVGRVHAPLVLRRLPRARPDVGRGRRAVQRAPRARRRLAQPRARDRERCARSSRSRGRRSSRPALGVARVRRAALRVPRAPSRAVRRDAGGRGARERRLDLGAGARRAVARTVEDRSSSFRERARRATRASDDRRGASCRGWPCCGGPAVGAACSSCS